MSELRRLEAALHGAPDELLTMWLLVVAGVLVLIALRGPTLLKVTALAYCIFP
jgi:hypothetical protein